jgi:DNA repair protein SbcC/Rad50
MRPVWLAVQAFGPYADRQIIDFRDALEAGLFGIYGQTGSGKSMIFSAMTFALFGEATHGEQKAPTLRSDFADPAVQTEVELVFDIDDRRYVVLRRPEQMRPKLKGGGETSQPHEAFLFDATGITLEDIREGRRGKIIAEKKTGLVDKAIETILGYGAEPFRQIVLLPQGRFEKFLAAKHDERLAILRVLFDVSLYRNLAARLKEDAAAAEREIHSERIVCAKLLSARGFESTDALAAGIAEAEESLLDLVQAEKSARQSLQAAQAALQQAEKIEAQFKAVEDARKHLEKLRADKAVFDALADRVAKAERARLLVDPETHVERAASEAVQAEARRNHAQGQSDRANTARLAAAKAFSEENGRAAEMESLRRERDDLARFKQIVLNSENRRSELERALKAEAEAGTALKAANARLIALKGDAEELAKTLHTARETGKQRADAEAQRMILRGALAMAVEFEKAESDVQRAMKEVDIQASALDQAARTASIAQAAFEKAERDLAQVQALHLASRLSPGEACPVCGATDHPAPATGLVEHAGRDLAFRNAKTAWLNADRSLQTIRQNGSGAQSVLQERKNRLDALAKPLETAAAIRPQAAAVEARLLALGPAAEPAKIEMRIEGLSGEIKEQEAARDGLHDRHVALQRESAATRARFDEMLSGIPEALRDPPALREAEERAARLLAERHEARSRSEKAAQDTRDAALAAAKDLEAAQNALETSRNRHEQALARFHARLEETRLTRDEYLALKPMIATAEKDREQVEAFRSDLAAAESLEKAAILAAGDQPRPDMIPLLSMHREADENLTRATEKRTSADDRLEQLKTLRTELAETFRKLDEAEAASGPLRGLAGLMNGANPQKLDLETFAIGAMFDQVLEAANLRLGPMTANRYRLERDADGSGRKRGLGIEVSDIFTGKSRPTTTLSGGETFIAALSLALGLADIVESANGKIRLDTVFIDEGFGSLDTENGSGTLDQVLQVLNGLIRQNRAVGLISHVPLVQESIPNGFYIRKGIAGSSVEARGQG